MKYPDLGRLTILRYPDPRLRENAAAIRKGDAFLKELTGRMAELMQEAQGIGLAATQVGWPFRFVVINSPVEPGKAQGYINPVIIARSGRVYEEEGCLSVPGVFAKVRRAERVTVRATLPDGETVEMEAEGLFARAWQHEADHLDGSLFLDRVGPTARIMLVPRLREMEEEFRRNKTGSGEGEKGD